MQTSSGVWQEIALDWTTPTYLIQITHLCNVALGLLLLSSVIAEPACVIREHPHVLDVINKYPHWVFGKFHMSGTWLTSSWLQGNRGGTGAYEHSRCVISNVFMCRSICSHVCVSKSVTEMKSNPRRLTAFWLFLSFYAHLLMWSSGTKPKDSMLYCTCMALNSFRCKGTTPLRPWIWGKKVNFKGIWWPNWWISDYCVR